jgi:hypothetical protein
MPTKKSIEGTIKDQYSRFFTSDDISAFKSIAEYYLRQATKLKKKDIEIEAEFLRLWVRNIQKRLYIGMGCELLLKSYFLKCGYCINKPISKGTTKPPYRIQDINPAEFKVDDTFTFNELLDQLPKIICFSDHSQIMKGLKIAKVFRNKEGHIAVYWHKFDPQNYKDIEAALTSFYREAFSQTIKIRFSMQAGEKNIFEIE